MIEMFDDSFVSGVHKLVNNFWVASAALEFIVFHLCEGIMLISGETTLVF